MASHQPESVIIDVWTVPDGRQQEATDGFMALFEALRVLDGFLDGRLHASVDGTALLSYVRMRSAADRQNAENRPEIRAQTRALREIARPHPHVYELLRIFVPAHHSPGPPTTEHGSF